MPESTNSQSETEEEEEAEGDDEEEEITGRRRRRRVGSGSDEGEASESEASSKEEEEEDDEHELEEEREEPVVRVVTKRQGKAEIVDNDENELLRPSDAEFDRENSERAEGKEGRGEDKEDRANPMAVPTRGNFYLHDDRFSGRGGRRERPRKPRGVWEGEEKSWSHDKFEQLMKEEDENPQPRRERKPRKSKPPPEPRSRSKNPSDGTDHNQRPQQQYYQPKPADNQSQSRLSDAKQQSHRSQPQHQLQQPPHQQHQQPQQLQQQQQQYQQQPHDPVYIHSGTNFSENGYQDQGRRPNYPSQNQPSVQYLQPQPRSDRSQSQRGSQVRPPQPRPVQVTYQRTQPAPIHQQAQPDQAYASTAQKPKRYSTTVNWLGASQDEQSPGPNVTFSQQNAYGRGSLDLTQRMQRMQVSPYAREVEYADDRAYSRPPPQPQHDSFFHSQPGPYSYQSQPQSEPFSYLSQSDPFSYQQSQSQVQQPESYLRHLPTPSQTPSQNDYLTHHSQGHLNYLQQIRMSALAKEFVPGDQ